MEQLNESFHQILAELPVKQVGLDLQQFAMVARMMITFVYRNTFPSAVSIATRVARYVHVCNITEEVVYGLNAGITKPHYYL